MNLINRIEKNLFLSDWKAASNLSTLQELEITKIISIGNEKEFDFYIFHDEIEYLKIYLDDNEEANITLYFDKINKIIAETDGKILIHCQKGISCSVAIIISYLMSKGMNYEEAFQKIKKLRPYVKPNSGFIKQLVNYYKNDLLIFT